jgi:LysM repeat protein
MRKLLLFAVTVAVLLLATNLAPANAQGYGTYVVQPGDTIFSIAARFNVSVSELATINGIYDINRIAVGQVLVLPAPLSPVTPPQPTPRPQPNPGYTPVITTYPPGTVIRRTVVMVQYVVKRGDTLSSIAARFRITPQALMQANGINNPNLVYVGQLLNIPRQQTVVQRPAPRPRGVVGRVYIVQPGDTMFAIAARFRRDVWDIARLNGILNLNHIYAGQALYIP